MSNNFKQNYTANDQTRVSNHSYFARAKILNYHLLQSFYYNNGRKIGSSIVIDCTNEHISYFLLYHVTYLKKTILPRRF